MFSMDNLQSSIVCVQASMQQPGLVIFSMDNLQSSHVCVQASRQYSQPASQDWSCSVWTACSQQCAASSGTTPMPEFTVALWATTSAERLAPRTRTPWCLASCPASLAMEVRRASLTVLSLLLRQPTVAVRGMRRCFATIVSKVGWMLEQL